MIGRKFCLACAGVALVLFAARARAAAPATRPAEPDKFIRFVDDGHGGGRLETADVEFQNAAGVDLHLVAAVHIGEAAYYKELTDGFKSYDAVLYELVMAKDATPPSPGQESDSSVSQVQRMLTDMLDLRFQLDAIDYTQPNFVHADLDAETFQRLQEERGESFQQMLMKAVFQAMQQQQQSGVADNDDPSQDIKDAMGLLLRPDGQRQLKLVLARQLDNADNIMSGLFGPDGSVIITERNKAAIAAMTGSMNAGRRKLAIFFGGAHMPDLSSRVRAMGFTAKSVQWHTAWDLAIRPDQPSLVESLFDKMIDSISGGGDDAKGKGGSSNSPPPTPPSPMPSR